MEGCLPGKTVTPLEERQVTFIEGHPHTRTRPHDTEKIASICRLEPDVGLLSTIIRSVARYSSDRGIRHEDWFTQSIRDIKLELRDEYSPYCCLWEWR
jgi:hypothetical protein